MLQDHREASASPKSISKTLALCIDFLHQSLKTQLEADLYDSEEILEMWCRFVQACFRAIGKQQDHQKE